MLFSPSPFLTLPCPFSSPALPIPPLTPLLPSPFILSHPSPHTDPGTCYVCNSCTARSNGEMEQRCEGESPRRDQITSDCVETTAYTLLALLEVGDTDRTGCLAQWLIKQQNSFGSFGSSQVSHRALLGEPSYRGCCYDRMLSFVVSRVCGLSVSTVYLHCNMHPQCVELGRLLHLTEPPFGHCFLCILCQLHLLQDTIIGLKALAAFSRLTFTPEMNMTVEVETTLESNIIEIHNENRYTRHEVMVRSVCLFLP